ncbi:MAG: hypothetical protein DRR19_29235 [Candidatus Parabeggiatoa sp. nov. 1]|nr:MAG: hypothetical protein DRR19_29235 [Gammaproteobacteria bacterium]
MSREHLISKGVFKEKKASVHGFSWCKDRFATVGIESLTSKILCSKHNNDLSVVDNGGIEAVDAIEKLIHLCNERKHSSPSSFEVISLNVDGYLFERWLLKVVLNLSFQNKDKIGGMGEVPGIPPLYLLHVVFGKIKFSHYMGVYHLVTDGSCVKTDSEIVIVPIVKDSTIGVFYISIYSIDFLLSLTPAKPPENLRSMGVSGLPNHILDAKWLYRVHEMTAAKGGIKSHEVVFNWKN